MDRDIRDGDVFKFQYKSINEQGWDYRTHCFEGILVARRVSELNQWILCDTFWSVDGTGGKTFTIDKAVSLGDISFSFNLNDVEKISYEERVYYSDNDIFRISTQHGCTPSCIHLYKRKGAQRNRDKMLQVLHQRLTDARRTIQSELSHIEHTAGLVRIVEDGNLDVYI